MVPVPMMREILPDTVVVCEVRGDDASAYLLPAEAELIKRAVLSRQRDFTLARTCARRALVSLGYPPAPILQGARREPLWPTGAIGSITHCAGYAAAAVTMTGDRRVLGIDAEPHEPLPSGVGDFTLLEEERAWLSCAPADTHWDRVLFSAKEAIYKSWYPVMDCWLGFEDASIDINPVSGSFKARILAPRPAPDGGTLIGFNGRLLVRDGFIFTAVADALWIRSHSAATVD